MKVLLVTHYYSSHRGGIEIVAGELARRTAQAVDITWAASDCDPIPELPGGVRPMPMATFNTLERLTGVPFPIWSPSSLGRLRQAVRETDVVHLHDFAYMGNWIAFAAAGRFEKPVLITQHIGLVPYRSAVLKLLQRILHATAGRRLLGGATEVAFVSRVVMDYYKSFVAFPRPPILVSNGVDATTFVERNVMTRDRSRADLDLDSARPVLLFVGRFVEKKGLSLISSLARMLPNAQWLLAGHGPIDPRKWNAPNVRVIEGRSGAGLVSLYHAADLLVLPSVGEGLPLVVQEALSCGTPVLMGEDTARAVGLMEGAVFSCPVGDAAAAERWVESIRAILSRRSLPPSEIANFARSKWSWEKCASEYLAVYQALVAANPPNPIAHDA